MATTTCPKCGNSYQGSTCPRCGYYSVLSVIEEESEKANPSSINTTEKKPKHTITMAFLKCNDCGKIYATSLEACPKCGCPTDKQPALPTIDYNTPLKTKVCSDKAEDRPVFLVGEDKFEETKDIVLYNREDQSSSIDDVCKSLDIDSPSVFVSYHNEKGIAQLQINYWENELIERIKETQDTLLKKYYSPCKQMIINIDDKTNIRLELEEGSLYWAQFPIDQEMFLNCCNAKKLEFKITKENGASIVVNGYYGFDPETGAEIDAEGNVVPENGLILDFQALYNYVIDPYMFTGAIRKRQALDDWWVKRNQEKKRQAEREMVKRAEPKKPGSGYLFVGIILTVLGLILFLSNNMSDEPEGFFVGIFSGVTGVILLIYGVLMKQGYTEDDVTIMLGGTPRRSHEQ